MTGWGFLFLLINILTASSALVLIVLLGKFFCVSILELIFDYCAEETYVWIPSFWCLSSLFLIGSWIGYTQDINELAITMTVMSTLCWIMYICAVFLLILRDILIPGVYELHMKIKERKQS